MQMVCDQPFGQCGFFGRKAQARPQAAGDAGAGNRVVFGPPFRNIMQKNGQEKHFPIQVLIENTHNMRLVCVTTTGIDFG